MANSLKPLIDILKFNKENLMLSFDGINDETALKRVVGGCPNSFAYEACHMIDSRYMFANVLGVEAIYPWKDIVGLNKKCTDGEDYPKIEEIKSQLLKISSQLEEFLENMSEEVVTAEIPRGFPMMEKTNRGAVAFLTWHDSYHLGHIGSIRTALKLAPIKDIFHVKHG